MSTTIHLPPPLLGAVDAKATEKGCSRNRYIRDVLEEAVARTDQWSSGFLATLAETRSNPEMERYANEMRLAITQRRSTKDAPTLKTDR